MRPAIPKVKFSMVSVAVQNRRRLQLGTPVLLQMNDEIDRVLLEVINQPYWKYLAARSADRPAISRALRELMSEIALVQQAINEAAFTAIGRFGKRVSDQDLVASMVASQLTSVGQAERALEDCERFGGHRNLIQLHKASPPAFVIISAVRHVAEQADPLSYLGCVYLFSKLTAAMFELGEPLLQRAGISASQLQFFRWQMEKDDYRDESLAEVIARCSVCHAGATEAILYGFECLRVTFPHAVWRAACTRAMSPETLPMRASDGLPDPRPRRQK